MDWGTLINPDKSPAALLDQLCLGIAAVIPTLGPCGTTDLTPECLAAFYRKVGGDYDQLFLSTRPQALSFIYQSIGCFQSLRPSTNAYEPPSTPCLLPSGYVRWQTIQLLMDPDEHWQYLSNALQIWDIYDANGNLFPKTLPRDSFPSEPDAEMLKWHEDTSARLERDYLKRQAQSNPSSPPNFSGGGHYTFTGKDPLPDEEDYLSSASRLPKYKRQSRHEPEPPRQRYHHRQSSGEYPEFLPRRRPEAYYARDNGGRSGMASPRCPSPASRPDHQHAPRMDHHQRRRTRGREHPSGHAHPSSPERDELDPEPESGYTTYEDEREPVYRRRRSHRHHNLSPPEEVRTRRHSHDAYTRKPVRDLSPHAPRRTRDYEYDTNPMTPRPRKSNSDGVPLHRHHEGRSRSRPSTGINWKEYIFGTHHEAPAPPPEPLPVYVRVPNPRPPRHRHHFDPYLNEDLRRGSYGGTPGTHPGSGSGPERPRAFSTADYSGGASRFASPQRGCAPKRYPAHPQEMPYMPRRTPHAYDQ